MLEFYEGVPERLRPQLTWHPPAELRRLAAEEAPRDPEASVIRCVFNPFRPMAIDPTWRTPTVLAITRRIREERDFAALPVLADALEDAGCADRHLLAHFRQPEEHVGGCWAVNLILNDS
jgi:hypothetical protein